MLLISMITAAAAASLAGVTLPDTFALSGQELRLNGMGLREKYYLDIYVCGLYVPTPSRDAQSLIGAEVPKRIVLEVVYSELPKDRIIASFEEDFGRMPGVEAQRASIAQLQALMPALKRGDQLAWEYVPGKGTSMVHNGQTLGTIPGSDFMRLVYSVYLGPTPPTEALKRGLLGG